MVQPILDEKDEKIKFFKKYWKYDGLHVISLTKAGLRGDNQDEMSIEFGLDEKLKRYYLFGVYDGHGEQGDQISEDCAKHLPKYIANHLRVLPTGYDDTENYFKTLDVKGIKGNKVRMSGTTALTVMMTPKKNLYIAFAGDSSVFIMSSNKSTRVNIEHNCHNKTEPEIIDKVYPASSLDLLVLASDGITDRFKIFKKHPTEIYLSFLKKHKGDPDRFVRACDGMIELCDTITEKRICVDDMSIIIIIILNGKSEDEWYHAVTKNAENLDDWIHASEEEDLSEIDDQDIYDKHSNEVDDFLVSVPLTTISTGYYDEDSAMNFTISDDDDFD
ncbi:35290_t:CDS:2 [Racocetra persica]|uniref:35290_t:CDS:1 n=1 Tax=Racocetra persica TaxID=160502 RepID=A0ACA9LA31_9GLOM|nr:35290_t:CDS:2 [Racocetra persica]